MSTVVQEAQSLDRGLQFLRDIGSGTQPINGHARELRALARDIGRHSPLAPGSTWLRLHGIDDDTEGM